MDRVRPVSAREENSSGSPGSSRRNRVALLLDLGSLAAQRAQVVELGPTHVTSGHDLDPVDNRGVNREGPLDADPEAHLSYRERLPNAAAGTADHDALEDLNAGARSLNHLDVNLE